METAKHTEPIKPSGRKITPELLEWIGTADYSGFVHLIPRDNKWRVIKHGSMRAIGTYNDQITALSVARKSIGSLQGRHIVIHGQGGEVIQIINP